MGKLINLAPIAGTILAIAAMLSIALPGVFASEIETQRRTSQIDKDTVALWLFDEFSYPYTTLTDASPYARADLRLMEGGEMGAGKFGRALRVRGGGPAVAYAGFSGKVPEEELREPAGMPSGLWGPTEASEYLLNGLAGRQWTVEFWLRLEETDRKATLIDLGRAYLPGFSIHYDGFAFDLWSHYSGVRMQCPARLVPADWHHIAFVRDGSEFAYFVDGKVQAMAEVASFPIERLPDPEKAKDYEHESRGFEVMDSEQRRQRRFNFAIGGDRRGANTVNLSMDELRISRVARYKGDFTPRSFSANFGPHMRAAAIADGPPPLFDLESASLPLSFGTRKHLFIDDAILDRKENLEITLNHPFGKEPVVTDFKIGKASWRPSVYDVDGIIHMAIPEGYSSNEGTTFLATSHDGLTFVLEEPAITDTPLYGAFFKDLNPHVPADERYKLNAFVANRGMYFYTSADGRQWKRNETIQLPLRSGGGGECYWDDQRGLYVSYLKRDSSACTKAHPCERMKGHRATVFYASNPLNPWPFNPVEEPYFEGWPFPVVTGEGAVGFYPTESGWVYRTRAIKYPWAPDVYLAFIWRYPGDDGARHVELAVSRDGQKWSFFGANWYFPPGAAEEEIGIYGMIRRGDELWQYVDEGGAHGGSAPRSYSRFRQRIDGFVSLDAKGAVGTATTLPLRFEGRRLLLNVVSEGWLRVAVTDESGLEYPGFGLRDCDPISMDATEYEVSWQDPDDLSSLAGKSVRLRFEMQDTKLFAFEFRD